MGQKTHPIGLRIGIYRKWASSWYGDMNKSTTNQSFGVIASRGGSYLSGMEDLLSNIFKRYSVTKFTKTPRILLVDLRLFKGFGGHRYAFMLYTKLLMRKLLLFKSHFMNSNTTSFFTKQKQLKPSVANSNKNKFVVSNSAAMYIFDQYVFAEDSLYKASPSSSICESENRKLYSIFLHLSPLYILKGGNSLTKSLKLDILVFYMTLQLGLKVRYSIITGRPNDLAFFCYYTKAFRNHFYINSIFDVSKQVICATKQSRLDYQRKFESRRQGTFIRNGSQGGVSLFNRIFCKNNSFFIAPKKKVKKLFAKKLRSTKALRGAVLEDAYTKRFQSQEQKVAFIKLYKKAQTRRKSVAGVFKPTAVFPQSIWFRNQVLKVMTRQKRGQKYGKKGVNLLSSNLLYVQKGGSYTKTLIPTALHFKLLPTEYEESTLNPNKFAQFKALVSFITQSRFSFYQINALSLTRYRFDSKIRVLGKTSGSKIKLSYSYLTSMERQRVSRYRYIGVYLKDLIRVCFLSRYLKKADFLATFFAFTISKLPRNRKELKFVHFLIKLLKRSAWQNKDILGVRIRFQGRLNRWRRTKHIVGSKGNLAFSSYHNRIEYGMAQAITRKGTLGVHIWIAYQPGSFSVLAKSIISYAGLTPLVVSLKKLKFSMFQPQSRYFRKLNRRHLRNTYENKSCRLCFGTFGIQSIEKGYLTLQQIEAVRRTLSSRLKRKGKIWIRAYPDSSCTAKPKEVRMGRGKGNVDYWYCTVKPGRVLFEVKTTSRYRALLAPALRFALRKLPRQAQIISRVNLRFSMYLSLVFFPLIGTILSGFGSRWRGDFGAKYITTFGVALTFCCSLYAFYEVGLCHSPCLIRVSPWRITETTTIYWGFLFDTLTCVRLVVVSSISTLVHLYSTEYMGHDPHLPRFRAYLSFFTFFRLILVTAENLVQRFVGWEGVGLCSYLLINFWFARIQANKSAIKARILNRIGDFGLSIAIFTIYSVFGSVDYSIIFAIAPRMSEINVPFFASSINILDFICFFLFIGAVGKSAQVGLHTWLPDAREGPTPVSALIHAATRVTAGVFLICRCSPLLEYAPNRGFYITLLGGRTAFLAATTGLLQNDLKRVIAYSTCSQLGYRVFAAGLSGYSVSRFHLSNHAFFKALLFLGAGSVIHARADEQDRRKRGGLVKRLPLTYTVIVVGSLALRGFPFLTGFYSKDVILELAYGSFTVEGRFVHTLGVFAAFFTAYYSTRLLARTFLRPANGLRVNYAHAHESPFPRAFPLVLLSFASLFVGFISRDRFIGLGTDFWGNALFTLPSKQHFVEAEWLETSAKSIPLVFSFAGRFLATYQYTVGFVGLFQLKETVMGRAFYTFLNRKWFFDKVYNEWIALPLLKGAYAHTYQNLDRGLLELYGPNGIRAELSAQSSVYRQGNKGFIFRKLFIRIWSLTLALLFLGGWIEFTTRLEIGVVLNLALFLVFFSKKNLSLERWSSGLRH